MMKRLFIPLALVSTGLVAEPPPPPTADQAPEVPAVVLPQTGIADEELEPQVSIIKRDDAVIREYRMNGQLYMVKVTPVVGPPYYLFDSTGDGNLDIRRNELDPGLVVPSWMIFRW